MSNFLSDEKFDLIVNCLIDGCSIRETHLLTGVAKETIHRQQKQMRIHEFIEYGFTKVYTGKDSKRKKTFYITKEWRDHWGKCEY